MFKFNGKLLMAISSIFITQVSEARGEWDNFRSATPEALFGDQNVDQDIAQNELYRVRVSRMNGAVKNLLQQCQRNNHSLEMAQFENMILTDGITISSLYSKNSGKLISVLARGRVVSQGKKETKIMALNSEDCSIDSFTKTFFGYRNDKSEAPHRSPRQPPLDPAAPENIYQGPECSVSIKVRESNPQKGYVTAKCNSQGRINVLVMNNKMVVCDYGSQVTTFSTVQCEFDRDISRPATVDARITFKGLTFKDKEHFSKEPTFQYPVRAHYVETSSQLTASAEKQSFILKGTNYNAEIKVKVEDNDILSEDPQNEIWVRLYNTKTKKLVSTRLMSTNQTTTFLLNAFFETPRFFGQPKWHDNTSLQPGVNEFAVVVNDAYQDDDKNPLVLEKITIIVPEN